MEVQRHQAVYSLPNVPRQAVHERQTHLAIVRRIAALIGLPFAGDHSASAQRGYLVPDDTVIGVDAAEGLGIHCEDDLFGGVVPHPFVATKAITHPLVGPDALAPEGWNPQFAAATEDAVLRGFTVFSVEDARSAAARLLERGGLRLKATDGRAGSGQEVISGMAELERTVGLLDPLAMQTRGLVLEEDLSDVVTYSVGWVRLAGMTASYFGTQRLTRDNAGRTVYGGSDLEIVPGGLDALLRHGLDEEARRAVTLARRYDTAAGQAYPGLCASRRNYDVALGTDENGERRCGVLEQSWRVGGATPAEILALEIFAGDPAVDAVRGCAVEIYGDATSVPPDAVLFYAGEDEEVGRITKYARAKPYER